LCKLGHGESMYAIARIVCVCVPCVFHYVHSGTYLGLWWGYGVRILFWSLSVSLVFQEERERRYWGHLSFFLINDFDNLLSWFRFFLLSMVYFCPRGGNVLQLDGEREVQREILWVEEERRGSIHSSPNCKFCARFVLIGESALQDGKVCLLCIRVERLWSASRWSRCTCSV
jgi:hypothetical protein